MHPSLKILEEIYSAGPGLRQIAVFAPHPDDEIIGAFSILRRCRAASFLVFVTDGAPAKTGNERATLQCERQGESEKIALFLGIPRDHLYRIGIPDQETVFQLPRLIVSVFQLLWELRPDIVIIPAYEGGHPDHDSTAFAVHQAADRLGQSTPLIEMCLYHECNSRMQTGEFLCHSSISDCLTILLSDEDRRLKEEAFAIYRSQADVLKYFSTELERFRPAPNYDFQYPPHSGTLFYERFDWGVTGTEWRRLSLEAMNKSDLLSS
ncbi:MAG: PIG-L family deacetylase [Verrucomicrobia bacterium]|nr:PIG-L family deacetylase [Verrucomicrobiota bacterium]